MQHCDTLLKYTPCVSVKHKRMPESKACYNFRFSDFMRCKIHVYLLWQPFHEFGFVQQYER